MRVSKIVWIEICHDQGFLLSVCMWKLLAGRVGAGRAKLSIQIRVCVCFRTEFIIR
jgi:hypothetical protein